MRIFASILLGKIIFLITRFLKIGGGSAAPGLYALKLNPNLVNDLSKTIKKNIIVTGTNGKTTTAKLLTHFALQAGLKVIRNHTGSNLERGIASTLIQKTSTQFDLGIWELDEAAFNSVARKLNPDLIVFLNVFRDQLDRYGEVDTVVKNWCKTLTSLSANTTILINGDDANLIKLLNCFKGKTQQFVVHGYKIKGETSINLKSKQKLEFEAKNVKQKGLKGSVFSLIINHKPLIINLPVPGIYHIYNFLAAFATGINLGINPEIMVSSLSSFSPAFGRTEKLPFGYIFLIKNPAGATQVLETITPDLKPQDRLLIALNDNIADGTDVSWIWDAAFEGMKNQTSSNVYIVSGSRAYDLAVRLKYAGVNTQDISIEPNLEIAYDQARKNLKGRLFILPTYTAMLELQKILTAKGLKKHYWKSD